MTNLKLLSKVLLVILIIIGVFSLTAGVFAAEPRLPYVPLAPLPGIGENHAAAPSLPNYLVAMFKLLIGIAAALAVIMIMIGGVQYMSTDAIGGKTEGKEKINQALTGLVLAIAAWLILNTINPDILKFHFNPETPPPITVATSTSNTLHYPAGAFYKYEECYRDGLSTIVTHIGTFPHEEGNENTLLLAERQCENSPPTLGVHGATSQCNAGSKVFCEREQRSLPSGSFQKNLYCYPVSGTREDGFPLQSFGVYSFYIGDQAGLNNARNLCRTSNPALVNYTTIPPFPGCPFGTTAMQIRCDQNSFNN